MTPLEFYELGLALSRSAAAPAEHRTVIGRLYYGLHHEACCRYFRERPGAPALARVSRHSALASRFAALDASSGVDVLLRQLSRIRSIADYELGDVIRYNSREFDSRQLMNIALIVSGELLRALDEFSPGAAADGCRCLAL